MKTRFKILIPLSFLVIDVILFTVIRLNLPEWYNKIINSISDGAHVSIKMAKALLLLGGFIFSLILISIIFIVIYKEAKRRVKFL